MSTNPGFPGFPVETTGRPRHRHSQPCPYCRRWIAPFDDEPWHEGREWTSVHRCRQCQITWTASWQYPSGDPEVIPVSLQAVAPACPWCGSQVGAVPWAWSHSPDCPHHQPRGVAEDGATSCTEQVVAYIDAHREESGVQPICQILAVAPSTYYAARSRRPSARMVRDDELPADIWATWAGNYRSYGARKCGEP